MVRETIPRERPKTLQLMRAEVERLKVAEAELHKTSLDDPCARDVLLCARQGIADRWNGLVAQLLVEGHSFAEIRAAWRRLKKKNKLPLFIEERMISSPPRLVQIPLGINAGYGRQATG